MRGNWKGHCTSFVYALFIGMIVLFVTSSLKDEVRVTPVLSSSRNVLPRDIPKPQSFGGRRDNGAPTGFAFGPIQGSSQNVAPPQKLVITAGETEARQSTYAQLILPSFPTAIPNVFLNDIPVSEYKNPLPTFLHHPKSGGTTMKKCLTTIADQSGLTITPFLCGKDRLNFDENLLRGLYHGNSFDLAAGDVSMGTCKRMPEFRSCAYYTIVREPYDRAISQYFFCLGGGHTSTSCENKTVEEYVLNVGSLFLRQLVYETTCSPRTASSSNKIEDSDRPWRCAVNYQLRLSNEDRQRLVDHLIQEMESIFAVIGITEEFEQSLELIQDALNISFYDTCRDYRYNVGPVDSQTKASKKALEREKVEAKRTLLANPEIREVLHPDILLYEKARQIFEKQKEIYLRKKKKNQV